MDDATCTYGSVRQMRVLRCQHRSKTHQSTPPYLQHSSHSRYLRSSCRRKDTIKRLRCRNKKLVPLRATERKISNRLRYLDLADQSSISRKTMNAVAGACPYVAVYVGPEAVRNAGVDVAEDPAVCEFLAVHDVEEANVTGGADVVACGGVGDIEFRLVR